MSAEQQLLELVGISLPAFAPLAVAYVPFPVASLEMV